MILMEGRTGEETNFVKYDSPTCRVSKSWTSVYEVWMPNFHL